MGKRKYRYCRRCKAERVEWGDLSYNGLCRPCGATAQADSLRGMATHSGPYWRRWLEAQQRAIARLTDADTA